MTLGDRIYLTWSYGRIQLIVGAVYNIVCAQLLTGGFSYSFLIDAFIIKTAVYAVTYYLVRQFRGRDAIFFYINLGLSSWKLRLSVLLVDFLALAVLLTTVTLIYG